MPTLHTTGTHREAGRPAIAALAATIALTLAAGLHATAATEEPTDAAVDELAADYLVLVRGTLFTDDLEAAQAAHDGVAAGGEEAARSAGDVYHLAALGTGMLGGSEGSFLGLDRWLSPESIEAFYADPAIAEAFGALFAAEPTIEVFERRAEWYTWGELPLPTAADERWIAVVRGRLAEADPIAAREGHDAVASAAQTAAEDAGDIAHVVFTALADGSEFLALDVWERADGIEAVYGDAAFQEAFATLFEAPPTLEIYRLTDWYQWP